MVSKTRLRSTTPRPGFWWNHFASDISSPNAKLKVLALIRIKRLVAKTDTLIRNLWLVILFLFILQIYFHLFFPVPSVRRRSWFSTTSYLFITLIPHSSSVYTSLSWRWLIAFPSPICLSACLVSVKFSTPSLLIMCPRKFNRLFLIMGNSVFFVSICLKTFWS